jgi:hypothetical protein
MKPAIVTLVIGDEYQTSWRAACEPGWRAYAERHGYDLIVATEPLDTSARAAARSPAWQKCLVLGDAIAGGRERIVWVDADVMINPAAPAITDGVPIEKIGAIDEHQFPTPERRLQIVRRLVEYWQSSNPSRAENLRSCLDPAAWHAFAGLPRRGRHILQTGVMVLSPRHHRELLEHVYASYEDRGGYEMNYEMRPLSFEAQEHNLQHWIDRRFNALTAFLQVEFEEIEPRRMLNTIADIAAFLTAAYRSNYFLHFANQRDYMKVAYAAGLCSGDQAVRSGTSRTGLVPRLSIVIPYRDRLQHLVRFVPTIAAYIARQTIDIPWQLTIVEQVPGKPFNPGLMRNIGFLATEDEADYFCFHDVDYLPVSADYQYPWTPARLCRYGAAAVPIDPARPDEVVASDHFFGGAVMFNKADFRRVNGYSNDYWGGSFADADLRLRCVVEGLTIEHRDGTYEPLVDDGHKGLDQPSEEHIRTRTIWDRKRQEMPQTRSYREEGLSTTRFAVRERHTAKDAAGNQVPNIRRIVVEV